MRTLPWCRFRLARARGWTSCAPPWSPPPAASRGRRAARTLRLPVDRVFSVRGSGTVVTGTLWSGRVAAGDEVEILPGSVCARVRGVQEHGVPVDVAEAGNRVALNLGAASTADVRPGMFLAAPGSVRPTDRFDAWVAYLGAGARGERLETGTRVRVAHGTAEVAGRVLFMDGCAAVQPREGAYAQIRLDDPLPLSGGDRFVVRSMTPCTWWAAGRCCTRIRAAARTCAKASAGFWTPCGRATSRPRAMQRSP